MEIYLRGILLASACFDTTNIPSDTLTNYKDAFRMKRQSLPLTIRTRMHLATKRTSGELARRRKRRNFSEMMEPLLGEASGAEVGSRICDWIASAQKIEPGSIY